MEKETRTELLHVDKVYRSKVIAQYLKKAHYRGAVCFSCGNASRALIEEGVYVVEVSPNGPLSANRWVMPFEIHRMWPDLFDATPGHLPLWMLVRIAEKYRELNGEATKQRYLVATGSGESILMLKMAYPGVKFCPVYNVGQGSDYNIQAPLNHAVVTFADM